MATVSGFESLSRPTRSDLKQFHELFLATYLASSDEARRQAVAALSQCPVVPQETALFIARQPIAIAAIFLTRSSAISETTLLGILPGASPAHARAIERRDSLSPRLIENLVGLHQAHRSRGAVEHEVDREATLAETRRQAREEELREEIKALARAQTPAETGLAPLAAIAEIHLALIVRFARSGETGMLSVTLADALGSSQWLTERILLDISGQQLATVLVALAAPNIDCTFVLTRLYPHLAQTGRVGSRADMLLAGLERAACVARVESWRRADAYTHRDQPLAAGNAAGTETPSAGASRRAAG
ncbi:uncharacterized protein (DUF2336 family) [Mycoplana sp. BE70]|uniref:hypothetical protein n=1 Tax=Mycoplana sp. BE70 TaxID=2817775 RepID=UPI00285893F3|nr:hypothetical protein [Mycoplana sp. BE70]MDR6755970.1 uncharacterized protein (DUF2336 family) [Mycoplana sp. BE70]